jgi:hypothetical protein
MNWNEILTYLYNTVLFPVITLLGIYLVALISSKIKTIKENKNNELYDKYLTMLNDTITSCVLATTQTYVDSLKAKGEFDADAQKVALSKTYNNVMKILAEDAKKYLTEVMGDFETYVFNRIEAEVICNK